MAKRRADKEINHDNWAEEDEQEEPGQFKQADPEEMKRRVIKIGRRSLNSSTPTASPFSKLSFASTPVASFNGSSSTNDTEFLGRLKSLNECLLRWMKQHMENSPYCDFTPVFSDYQKHLQELKQKYLGLIASSQKVTEGNNGFAPKTATLEKIATPKFGPGVLGSLVTDATTGSTGPCTVSFPEPCGESSTGTEEEPYVPPQNEFTVVQEDGAVYSKRCKLFYKKDNAYVDRGVGTLYVKPVDGKNQLLMRADTNLGNILLNILLVSGLPVSRLGNRDVALICVPNPPIPKCEGPTTFLLRVKTAADADELAETLDKFKK